MALQVMTLLVLLAEISALKLFSSQIDYIETFHEFGRSWDMEDEHFQKLEDLYLICMAAK